MKDEKYGGTDAHRLKCDRGGTEAQRQTQRTRINTNLHE
jgi:hypothetical protein